MNKKIKLGMNLLYTLVLALVFITSVKSTLAISEPVKSTLAISEPVSSNQHGDQSHYTTVIIYNQMKDGSNFTIRCKSKDDDLGTHVVEVGKPYDWRFRPNIWGTTLFFCNTYWKGKFIGFNGYDAGRDEHRCNWNCNWVGSEDGLFGYLESSPNPDIQYVWK